jgi:hypothetical protein
VLNIVNTALQPLGLNVQWPVVKTLPDGTVEITPLVVGIDNNTLGQEVVGTNLGTVQPVREALVNALLKASCQFASAITVSDIGIGVLAGGGNLNLEFGGAKALTNNEAASSPFGPGSSPFGASTGSNSALGNTGVGAEPHSRPRASATPDRRRRRPRPRVSPRLRSDQSSERRSASVWGRQGAGVAPATWRYRSAWPPWRCWAPFSRGTTCGSVAACS